MTLPTGFITEKMEYLVESSDKKHATILMLKIIIHGAHLTIEYERGKRSKLYIKYYDEGELTYPIVRIDSTNVNVNSIFMKVISL